MNELYWIKLKLNIFNDEKITLIEAMHKGDTIILIWIRLLTLAGKTNSGGFIFLSENIPYTPEMLSAIFHRPLPDIKLALKTFTDLQMIEIYDDGSIFLPSWEKHQNSARLEEIREQNRIRQARFRERQKKLGKENNKKQIESEKNEEEFDQNTMQLEASDPSDMQKQDENKEIVTPHDVTVTHKNKSKNKNKKKSINVQNPYQKRTDFARDRFIEFWNLYDKKVNKERCYKKWLSLYDEDRQKIFEHLPAYIESTPDKQFRKDPFTYLDNESWNDEIITEKRFTFPEETTNGNYDSYTQRRLREIRRERMLARLKEEKDKENSSVCAN
ncbi:phage replisome organizer N-terminal domain-containing protein [Bacteroidota bacterium]